MGCVPGTALGVVTGLVIGAGFVEGTVRGVEAGLVEGTVTMVGVGLLSGEMVIGVVGKVVVCGSIVSC